MNKIIAIGSDHAGFSLKEVLKKYIEKYGYIPQDLGTNTNESVDYADYGYAVAKKVLNNEARFGVLICGTGIGISIAANRNPKIRAAICHNEEMSMLARQHNDANILVLGARIIDEETAIKCLKTFLETDFEGGRHLKRVEKLSKPQI